MTSRVAISPKTSLTQELVEAPQERVAQPFLLGYVALPNDGSQHNDSDAPGSDTDADIDADTETDIEDSEDEADIED
ncbi:hypothetical protein BGX34_005589, partial [Mortierella sp. NVP85]